jgi:hypothetical protein
MGSLSAKNASEKFSRLGTFKETVGPDYCIFALEWFHWISLKYMYCFLITSVRAPEGFKQQLDELLGGFLFLKMAPVNRKKGFYTRSPPN